MKRSGSAPFLGRSALHRLCRLRQPADRRPACIRTTSNYPRIQPTPMHPSDPKLVKSGALPYLVSAPRTGETLPVLCFLHGYDEAAPLPIEQGVRRHGPLSPTAAAVSTTLFIVVAPQLPRRGDLWHRYADAVKGIVQDVQAEHGGDPERTYLTGFSFGANGVFDLALSQPDMWSALWPVDPTRVPEHDPERPVWLASGEISRRNARAFTDRLRLSSLTESEPADRVYVDYDLDHVGTASRAYGDERIYRWLLEHRSVGAHADEQKED